MNKKSLSILLSLALITWAVFFFKSFRKPSAVPVAPTTNAAKRIYDPTECDIRTERFVVDGSSMEPMIHNGSVITLRINYYNCGNHPLRSSDIVVFENPFTRGRVIKKLSMVPGDHVAVDREAGTVTLNGTVFANSKGEVYKFSKNELGWFDIYVKNGVLESDVYFIFWDNVRNSVDSRKYWPVSIEGILGKVDR